MELSKLIKSRPQLPPRFLLYSIPGWGKSTFAASMPKPIFFDLEDGLRGLKVDSFPVAKTYEEVIEYMRALIKENGGGYKTVVLDTATSLERLIFASVCKEKEVSSVDSIGYGKGRLLAIAKWEKIITGLEKLRETGLAIMVLAHSQVKTVYDPLTESYDKFMLTLDKNAANLLTEKSDNIFFGTQKVVVSEDDAGFKKVKRGLGQGERVIFTEERPGFLAKSRDDYEFQIDIPKENGWGALNKKV